MYIGITPPEDTTIRIKHAGKVNQKNLNIVFIGGGGGSEAILRALSRLARRIAAIIAVSDDGGDSGRLREGLGWAPGDVRRALYALASNVSGPLARLFCTRLDSRFPDRTGQSFGNNFFAAAAQDGLDIASQIDAAARLLGVIGQVFPATYETVGLIAEMSDGLVIHGESAIAAHSSCARRVRLDPETAAPPAEALRAIAAADCIVVGPGSVVTSLIPALLPSMGAVATSRAARFLVMNAWNEGDYDRCSAADYVRLIASHLPGQRLFDCVLVHQPAEGNCLAASNGRLPVKADLEVICAMGYDAVGADLLGPDGRHDGARVAALIATLTPKFSRQMPQATSTANDSVKSIFQAQSLLETRKTSCPSVRKMSCRVRRRRAETVSVFRSRPAARIVMILRRQCPTSPPAPSTRCGGSAGRGAFMGNRKSGGLQPGNQRRNQ